MRRFECFDFLNDFLFERLSGLPRSNTQKEHGGNFFQKRLKRLNRCFRINGQSHIPPIKCRGAEEVAGIFLFIKKGFDMKNRSGYIFDRRPHRQILFHILHHKMQFKTHWRFKLFYHIRVSPRRERNKRIVEHVNLHDIRKRLCRAQARLKLRLIVRQNSGNYFHTMFFPSIFLIFSNLCTCRASPENGVSSHLRTIALA